MSITYDFRYIGEKKRSAEESDVPVLLTFSKVKNEEEKETRLHRHTHLEVFYFESGRGVFECEGTEFEIGAGDILIVDAGVRHRQHPDKEDPLIYYGFAATNVQLGAAVLPDAITKNGYGYLPAGRDAEAVRLVELCKNEAQRCEKEHLLAISAYFTLLLVRLARILAPVEQEREEQNVVASVKVFIEANFDREFSLDDLAAKFYINKSTLLHTFKRAFGTSPLRYRNLCRVERAKKMLASGASVTQAAIEVGFSGSVYFAEIFRKLTGETPSAYRKTALKKQGRGRDL